MWVSCEWNASEMFLQGGVTSPHSILSAFHCMLYSSLKSSPVDVCVCKGSGCCVLCCILSQCSRDMRRRPCLCGNFIADYMICWHSNQVTRRIWLLQSASSGELEYHCASLTVALGSLQTICLESAACFKYGKVTIISRAVTTYEDTKVRTL
jgi:hypothetical protein